MLFETERLYVTRWMKDDLQSLYAIFNDVATKEFILPELTIEETAYIFQKQLKEYENNFPFGRYFIVEKVNNNFIGLFLIKKLSSQTDVEIGYSLIKERWNNGYATEIVLQAIKRLFNLNQFSGIYAVTEPDNIESQHVLYKCGFLPDFSTENSQNEVCYKITR